MGQRRILALCTQLEQLDALVRSSDRLAKQYDAGVTLLYVKEEKLFELPLFSDREDSLETVRDHLQRTLAESGHKEWAVLVYENDVVDHARLEARREKSVLVISDDHEEIDELVGKIETSLLVLKREAAHEYARVLLALDSAYSSERGIDFVLEFARGAKVSCYLDYQLITSMADPGLDPVVGAMTPDVLMEEETEVIRVRKESFQKLCEEKGLSGEFELGEHGLVQDILRKRELAGAELLAIVAEDHDTLLAEAAREIAAHSPVDVLIHYHQH